MSANENTVLDAPPFDSLDDFIDRYFDDRVAFAKEVCGFHKLAKWQEEALRDLDNGTLMLAVRSGHGVGKSSFLAVCAYHFVVTRYPCKIAITAPTEQQLQDALFAEMKRVMREAEMRYPEFLGGLLSLTANRVTLNAAPEGAFISLKVGRKENPEALAGVHAKYVLLIADEASGIPEEVYETAQGSLSTAGAIFLMTGNPTRAYGYFYDAFHKNAHLWTRKHVKSGDVPYVDEKFVNLIRETYGEGSQAWDVRVLGEFPKGDADSLIPAHKVKAAVGREITVAPGTPIIWGLDVARVSDRNVLVRRQGYQVLPTIWWPGRELMDTVGRVLNHLAGLSYLDRPYEICIDMIGLGAGVHDRLRELQKEGNPLLKDIRIVGVNVAEVAAVNPQAMRLRDDLWMQVRDWFATMLPSLPQDEDLLVEDLSTPGYTFTSSGKLAVERKEEVKKRLGRSTDFGDALCLTFGNTGAVLGGTSMSGRYGSNRKPKPRNGWVV